MNKTPEKTTEDAQQPAPKRKHPRHPYTLSNSPEETIRRMKTVSERIAVFLEKLYADRKTNPR